MGSDPVIFIRTDSNEKIAAGHMVRCFSVAEALLPHRKVCFLVSCEQSLRLLERLFTPETSCPVRLLQTGTPEEPEKELEELCLILQEAGDCVLLVDSYFVTEHYLRSLRRLAPIAYIDDLQLFSYPVDLVCNYDILPKEELSRCLTFYDQAEKVLLGGDYAPLRRQFVRGLPTLRPQVGHLLLTTGGSDPFFFSEELLETLPSHLPQSLHYHVVAGRYYTNKNTLRHLCERSESFHYYEDLRDMAAVMSQCDLAVCAAGTTLYELCALGIPAVCFTMADNQLSAAKAFARSGAVVYAGDLRERGSGNRDEGSQDTLMAAILQFLRDMCRQFRLREEAAMCMHRLVDGGGAGRIARALIRLADKTDP
ncbi:MAG: UDP-2,4-diacetamido-2,4,6-trideoxy-beta-L-altropyranose hydrolase [Lachnospiraceae bacterium]|nr:UDP-2,4-diacetamido-2,4,6-trideoxy-beta-L-altropyranose hydrolase [Lachnospiraceae bacterium]